MSKQGQKRFFSTEEVLKLLEEDVGSLLCPQDSSSDEEDLVHPAKGDSDSGDSDYRLPSSERYGLSYKC